MNFNRSYECYFYRRMKQYLVAHVAHKLNSNWEHFQSALYSIVTSFAPTPTPQQSLICFVPPTSLLKKNFQVAIDSVALTECLVQKSVHTMKMNYNLLIF